MESIVLSNYSFIDINVVSHKKTTRRDFIIEELKPNIVEDIKQHVHGLVISCDQFVPQLNIIPKDLVELGLS